MQEASDSIAFCCQFENIGTQLDDEQRENLDETPAVLETADLAAFQSDLDYQPEAGQLSNRTSRRQQYSF